jgi:hypothetical protein
MMRRSFVVLIAVALCVPLLRANVSAAQSTPTADALAAYPSVPITLTDSEIQLTGDQLPAGYVRLTVTNTGQEPNGVGLVEIPAGQSIESLAQATPEAGNFLPPFLYDVTVAGGLADVPPGQTWEQVVYLEPGQWVIFPENAQQPAVVTVAETADAMMTAPAADATITETNFAFSGTEGITAGPQVIEITNQSDQPHMVDFFQVPDGTTLDEVITALSAPEDASPVAGALQESDTTPVPGGQVLLQSANSSVWMSVDLAEGTYVMVCFVIDPQTGMPHAMEGMISLFETGSPAA